MKTKVAKGSLNPTFNETLQMNVDDPEEPILVEVSPAVSQFLPHSKSTTTLLAGGSTRPTR